MTDASGRRIDHLRLSVTSACDLRCLYCRPGAQTHPACTLGELDDGQRVDFICHLYRHCGLAQVRLTGGEALLHPNLAGLVESIKRHCPALVVALTTNGRLLSRYAQSLRAAGLDRLNVSVDSLDDSRYHRITGGRLEFVLEGLDAARTAGFPEPKINAVVLRDVNDGEIISLAEWAVGRGAEIRFLEAMPIGCAGDFNRAAFVSAADVRRTLASVFELVPIPTAPGSTATRYRVTAGPLRGVVGTIAPVSEPFCSSCRRIRITADGRMYPCLLDGLNVDIRPAWRNGRLDHEALARLVGSGVRSKKSVGSFQRAEMVRLGG